VARRVLHAGALWRPHAVAQLSLEPVGHQRRWELLPVSPGVPIKRFVRQGVLTALASALTLALAAAERVAQERKDLDRMWQHRLERATDEAERAARHYRSIEPEHRLVDRQLARDWEGKLSAPPHALSGAEREAISALAQDLPALWHAPTPMAVRKVRRRQSIHRALVTGEGTRERLQIIINWIGEGTTTGSTTGGYRMYSTGWRAPSRGAMPGACMAGIRPAGTRRRNGGSWGPETATTAL
jgi:hypothetical protein